MGCTMLEVQKIYYSIEEDVKNCFVVCVEEAQVDSGILFGLHFIKLQTSFCYTI